MYFSLFIICNPRVILFKLYLCIFAFWQALFKDPKCFVSIPELSSTDVSNILTKWLKAENRALQEHQLQVLRDAFKQCPLPLFLKISYDEARLWRSYSPPSETCLETTIRKAIDKLFERVEVRHGAFLVRRALGYITAGKCNIKVCYINWWKIRTTLRDA